MLEWDGGRWGDWVARDRRRWWNGGGCYTCNMVHRPTLSHTHTRAKQFGVSLANTREWNSRAMAHIFIYVVSFYVSTVMCVRGFMRMHLLWYNHVSQSYMNRPLFMYHCVKRIWFSLCTQRICTYFRFKDIIVLKCLFFLYFWILVSCHILDLDDATDDDTVWHVRVIAHRFAHATPQFVQPSFMPSRTLQFIANTNIHPLLSFIYVVLCSLAVNCGAQIDAFAKMLIRYNIYSCVNIILDAAKSGYTYCHKHIWMRNID